MIRHRWEIILHASKIFSNKADLAKELAIKQGGVEHILHSVQQMITVRSIKFSKSIGARGHIRVINLTELSVREYRGTKGRCHTIDCNDACINKMKGDICT